MQMWSILDIFILDKSGHILLYLCKLFSANRSGPNWKY